MRCRNVWIAAMVLGAGCSTTINEESSVRFSEEGKTSSTTVLDSRLKQLEKRASEYPKLPDIPYTMAGVHYQRQDFKESAKALERAIYIAPAEAKYHYQLGRVYLKMRELDKAEAAFRSALELLPDGRYTGVNAALGYVLCQRGDWGRARTEFEKCALIDPADPNPYYFLGCIDDARQDSRGAVENLKEYLHRGGDNYRSKAIHILASYGVMTEEAPPEDEDPPASGEGPPAKPGPRRSWPQPGEDFPDREPGRR